MARKEKNIHYIYKTTCNVTGKWYIGMHSTCNLEDSYMGSGLRLRHSIRKYGKDNHTKEILEFLPTREELVLREIEIVTKELIADDLCMNLTIGGEAGGFMDKEHQIKCSKAGGHALQNKIRGDKEFAIKHRKKMIEGYKKAKQDGKLKTWLETYSWVGKTHKNETKELISKKMKNNGIGETNSQYGTCWITRDGLNKKIKKENLETYLNEGWLKGRK